MSSLAIGFTGVGLMFVLMAVRMPIGLVLTVISIGGIALIRGLDVAYGTIRTLPFDFVAHWTLCAIPMFLLMGSVAQHSGFSASLFVAARAWAGRWPGGLAVASNFACAGFAAASGSSVATAAAMGRIALPEMINAGYAPGLATGVVASAGTLGSLIPPSILMVLYAVFAEVSISKMLVAGILPGILTALVYALMIVARCVLNPSLAPPLVERPSLAERLRTLAPVWPVAVLIMGIVGGIYSGLTTATEAGALGVFLAFVLALVQSRLGFAAIKESLVDTLVSTGSIFFVAMGAILLARFFLFSGIPDYLGGFATDVADTPILLIVLSSIAFLLLGMFLDPLGILLVSLPILLPLYAHAHIDLIWMGVIIVKYLEIGLLTPPVGFNVYVIKSVVGESIPLETIFKGVGWFLVCEFLIMVLLIAFPEISLVLPNMMG